MSYSRLDIDLPGTAATGLRVAPRLSIVIPCYNETAVLPQLFARLETLEAALLAQGAIGGPITLVLVDDGSQDGTWAMIEAAQTRLSVMGVRLSRNHGHQRALLAGLMQAPGDAVVSMDADLQDDPDAVIAMVAAYRRGAEVVFGVRASRSTDTIFKRRTARAYYDLLERLGVDLIPDHADFRLMSRKALRALSEFGETNLFLRALVRQLGFRCEIVTYDRAARAAGESKYTLGKMLGLAIDGITSFSVRPLRLITLFGFVVALIAVGFSALALLAWLRGDVVPGWTSIVLPLSLLGGAHLVALGVIGEYIGKIYQETKRRPRFLIDEIVERDNGVQARSRESAVTIARIP